MAGDLDLQRVVVLFGIAGTSAHKGEALSAIRLIDRMLRHAGMAWADLLPPYRALETATEAAKVLLAENVELRARVEELEAMTSSAGRSLTTLPQWSDAGMRDNQAVAKWVLDLHTCGSLYLTDFERGFLSTVARWKGRLMPKQAPLFESIIERIRDRSGMTPPGWAA
jgi:hypothetical protein